MICNRKTLPPKINEKTTEVQLFNVDGNANHLRLTLAIGSCKEAIINDSSRAKISGYRSSVIFFGAFVNE